MTVHDVIYWIYKYVYLSRVNTGISKMSREAVITQPKHQTSKKIAFTMLRSRIARTNSTLEIFIGIVDCRQKKIPIIFKISFTWFAFHIFYQLHFQAKLSSFSYLSPYSPMPLPLQSARVLSSHDALRRTTYIFHGIWVFSRVWSIKLRHLRSEYIFHL